MSSAGRAYPQWTLVALAGLLALSFGLRVWAASSRLDPGYSFDERYSLRNVSGILQKGELRPSHTMYLGLSYYPQTAVLAASRSLHRLTGWPILAVFAPDGRSYTPTAYFLCRLVNVIYGVLSLLVVFLLGARLHSPQLGLLAATLLAAFLRHLRSSAHFKPDILVVLLTAVVLYWTVLAVARPGLRRFLRVGLGVGLATATKYTGIAAALPITVGVLLFGRRDRRQWRWLALAALTAVGTFVALNPYVGVVFQFIPKLIHGYADHAVKDRSDRGVVLWRQFEFLVEQPAWWVAPFLFVAVAWIIARAWRPPAGWSAELRAGWTVVLALLVGHTVLHATSMTLFRTQNFMPVAPAAALVSAWGMIESWRWMAHRFPLLARPAFAASLWGLVALALVARQFTQVHDGAVPTTWQVARQSILKTLPARTETHLILEKALGNFPSNSGRKRFLVRRVERLSQLDADSLDHSDIEAFPAARLDESEGAFHRGRSASLPIQQVEVIRPRLFRSRGPAVVLLHHPWRQAGKALALRAETSGDLRSHRYELPKLIAGVGVGAPATPEAGETVSLFVVAPQMGSAGRRWTATCLPGGSAMTLVPVRVTRHRQFLVSARFTVTGNETHCELQAPRVAAEADLRVELQRWNRSDAAPASAASEAGSTAGL